MLSGAPYGLQSLILWFALSSLEHFKVGISSAATVKSRSCYSAIMDSAPRFAVFWITNYFET